MTDRLAALMAHFPVRARVFNAGPLCGINSIGNDGQHGQLHLLRAGPLSLVHGRDSVRITRPSLLFYPRPMAHRFITDAEHGADLVCAHLTFEGGAGNPVTSALPAFVCVPLDSLAGAEPLLSVLFEEAFGARCGRMVIVERLFEVVIVQVLRHLMESGEIRSGMLAGLAHPRLRHALVAMHEAPAREWSLEELARVAGMSRSAFAGTFREAVGVTPGQYLQAWRISLAQQALRRGRPLKTIAADVGYGSEAALSRAFKAQSGMSPRAWKRAQVVA
jgi:AraC-like DNA-binding protein